MNVSTDKEKQQQKLNMTRVTFILTYKNNEIIHQKLVPYCVFGRC